MSDIAAEIRVFFMDPWDRPGDGAPYGVLWALRRDIRVCLGYDANSPDKTAPVTGFQVLWPGVMCIFAGVDLLAKFWAGSDSTKPGEVGQRFRDFLQSYSHLRAEEAQVVWELRNSLLHSFSVRSPGETPKHTFVLTADKKGRRGSVNSESNGRHVVDIRTLHDKFEGAVARYREQVEDESETGLRKKFSDMPERYGMFSVLEVEVTTPVSTADSTSVTSSRDPTSVEHTSGTTMGTAVSE